VGSLVDPNEHDRFILRQRIRPIINQYEFSLPNGDGDAPGETFCFVVQKQGNPAVRAREKSMLVAFFRRLVGFVPYVGNYADWLPIPYHFEFLRADTVIGTHSRHRWKFSDVYTIDMSGDPDRALDRRLVLAIAVGMDALQAR
jgi:hypothetical protein